MPRNNFSIAEARRIALAAQGFDKPRPAKVTTAHVRHMIDRLGLLQLDFVNVLKPAHEFVPFSRLGPHKAQTFQRAVYGSGAFTEQWAHEASIVPVSSWPLLAHRRQAYRQSPRSPLFRLPNRKAYLEEVYAIACSDGPITSADVPEVAGPARKPGDWHRSVRRWALEHHFGRGRLAVADRLPNFQRLYDLPERHIPAPHLSRRVTAAEAQRQLLAQAAAALGIATSRDLADYYRMRLQDTQPRLLELAEQGIIRQVRVVDWNEPAWLHHQARLPRRIEATALLSPFDPLTWYRPRVERLFGFHYRIEIYVPEKERRWGYYVLPFLCGDQLTARVDLKADRHQRRLLVRAAHAEPGHGNAAMAARLADELRLIARWLELESIVVQRKGNFAHALGKAVRAFTI